MSVKKTLLVAVACSLTALVLGLVVGNGCHKPDVKPVVVVPPGPGPGPGPNPNPTPEPGPVRRLIILVRESGVADPAMNLLVTSLRGGAGEKFLSTSGHELIAVLDPDLVNASNTEAKLVKTWRSTWQGMELPAVLILDDTGKLTHKESLPKSPTLESVVSILTTAREPEFAANRWVDCDFGAEPQFVRGDTTEEDTFETDPPADPPQRAVEPKFGGADQADIVFEDAIPIIPREDWPAIIAAIDNAGGSLDLLVTRIYNQERDVSCTSNATCQATEIIEAMQWGKKCVVHKSAMSLYRRVGGPRSGSAVSANLREMTTRGVLPLKSPENEARFKHTMPNAGYRDLPGGWEETAKLFRGHEVFDVRSFDGFITALLRGYPVVYGRDGHAICAVRPSYKNGKLYVKYANSWGNWGDNGFGYDSEAKIRSGASWAFALRSVVDSDLTSAANVQLRKAIEHEPEPELALAP